jgi:uncharacterized membrane protein YgdD (TMEM256/DUF423 family)
MKTNALFLGALFGVTAVIAGAMGTHGLKPLLSTDQLLSYETAVKYQIYHALALLVIHLIQLNQPLKWYRDMVWCFGSGTLLFSGSIYLLSTKAITGITVSWLGPITPIGGSLLIAGWALLLIAGWKSMKT